MLSSNDIGNQELMRARIAFAVFKLRHHRLVQCGRSRHEMAMKRFPKGLVNEML
jgi:hypothetical protein